MIEAQGTFTIIDEPESIGETKSDSQIGQSLASLSSEADTNGDTSKCGNYN
jgi:hypothetical protein